jgi:hypothetical protein
VSQFDALFDEFRATAFRLEQRPFYNVGGQEAARIAAFEQHRGRPERSVRTDPWLARIAATTAAGKQWRRIRVVDHPLTPYQRYQLLAGSYIENQTAGDETLVIERAQAQPWLQVGRANQPLGDFWVFDRGLPTQIAVAADYTVDGQPLGLRYIADPVELDAALAVAAELPRYALPLGEFLASLERTVA